LFRYLGWNLLLNTHTLQKFLAQCSVDGTGTGEPHLWKVFPEPVHS
jgi:hypothetical protein